MVKARSAKRIEKATEFMEPEHGMIYTKTDPLNEAIVESGWSLFLSHHYGKSMLDVGTLNST